jgi:hypothetical protein
LKPTYRPYGGTDDFINQARARKIKDLQAKALKEKERIELVIHLLLP